MREGGKNEFVRQDCDDYEACSSGVMTAVRPKSSRGLLRFLYDLLNALLATRQRLIPWVGETTGPERIVVLLDLTLLPRPLRLPARLVHLICAVQGILGPLGGGLVIHVPGPNRFRHPASGAMDPDVQALVTLIKKTLDNRLRVIDSDPETVREQWQELADLYLECHKVQGTKAFAPHTGTSDVAKEHWKQIADLAVAIRTYAEDHARRPEGPVSGAEAA